MCPEFDEDAPDSDEEEATTINPRNDSGRDVGSWVMALGIISGHALVSMIQLSINVAEYVVLFLNVMLLLLMSEMISKHEPYVLEKRMN